MPTSSSYNYTGQINWGDGTGYLAFSGYNDTDFTHTYAAGGNYTVSITGTFEAMDIGSTTFPSQMKTVENLGQVGWKTFYQAFSG